jgi:flagellar hook-basal body complex protein FliE
MSNMQIDSVLSQIRAMSAQLHGQASSPVSNIAASKAQPGSFANIMQQGIDQVNRAQQSASSVADAFQRGAPGVELADVMLESQKASVSFRALTEVRNRFVNVYQEIMSMPI